MVLTPLLAGMAGLMPVLLPTPWPAWWVQGLGLLLVAGTAAAIPLVGNRRLRGERRALEAVVSARDREIAEANRRLQEEIAGRNESERALRENEARLREIVENSTNVFYSHTLDNEITYISPRVEEVLGVPVEEVPDRWTEFATDHPVNLEGMKATLRAVETGERQAPYELELRRGDGRLVRVQVTEAPLVRDGEVIGLVGSLTDITEGRLAHEERQRLEDQLNQARKMEAVGRLAAGIAHDFNNLLTSVMGHTSLMALELGPDHPNRHDLDQVEEACGRAAALVAQLLTFGRKQVTRPTSLELNRFVENSMRMLRRMVGSDIEMVLELGPENPSVLMDPSQMDQLLLNLVLNARDAMAGGGTLTLGTTTLVLDQPPADWDEPDFTPGERAILTVADTGEGMDPTTASRVFEPFFTTKGIGQGSGLGLATVYGIVKQNGGHIRLDTEPGRGTTFRICLPAAGTEARDGAAVAAGDGTGAVVDASGEPGT